MVILFFTFPRSLDLGDFPASFTGRIKATKSWRRMDKVTIQQEILTSEATTHCAQLQTKSSVSQENV